VLLVVRCHIHESVVVGEDNSLQRQTSGTGRAVNGSRVTRRFGLMAAAQLERLDDWKERHGTVSGNHPPSATSPRPRGPHSPWRVVAGCGCTIQPAESTDHPCGETRMRNLMLIVLLLAVVMVVIGFERGVIELTTRHNAGSRSVHVHLKVDADKALVDAGELIHIK
jgi:hypothetical protein